MSKEKFIELFKQDPEQCVGNVDEELDLFFSKNYTIVELNRNGVLGYSEHDNFYFIWFTHFDNIHSNAKLVYNIVKELSKDKAVLYGGVVNFFKNNSIPLGNDIYQLKIGE